ncbi:hypothetical protein jhhlp_008704 [Lomentospora prolificans]|uniref:Copper homeostasis protein cutC homolog n=1 Tax=Lomentospora prolificans TaxID=41688 RepID=A0A2N3MYT0_9PEZI|nr:hypothetical protein jhhlp_008704 [Lomentospora prolificans]
MPKITLEIPIFSPSSASTALAHGATRLELNAPSSYHSGGLTPPISTLSALPSSVAVPLRIMIRPRGPPPVPEHDFLYSAEELDVMVESIRAFKASGLLDAERGDGFVFGVLRRGKTADDELLSVDAEANARLVREARPFGCTFHRAFDLVLATGTSVEEGVEDLLACGFDGVLTSGGPGDAVDNLQVFQRLIEAVDGRLDVLVGGGVRAANASALLEATRAGERVWLHSSCIGQPGTDEVDEKEVTSLVQAMKVTTSS